MATDNEGLEPCICAHIPNFDSMITSNITIDIARHGHREISRLEKVANTYTEFHGVLSLLVCACGISMNMLNVFVLTRPHMRTPVNTLLTWLAMFDLLTKASYVPFSLHFYCFYPPWRLSAERNSLGWMTFLIVHVDFTATTHTISNWLGVTLAMFRYKHIFLPAKGHLTRIRRLVRARITVFVVVVLSVVVMVPNYIMNKIMSISLVDELTNITSIVFIIEPTNLGTPDASTFSMFNLWLHGVVAKLLPCILMVFYSALLFKTLRTNVKMISRPSTTMEFPIISVKTDANGSNSKCQIETETTGANCDGFLSSSDAMANHLLETSFESRSGSTCTNASAMWTHSGAGDRPRTPSLTNTGPQQLTVIKSRRPQDNARTTRMLLAIITLYVVSELPQAILIILSASLPGFFRNVYLPLGDMMDMLALLNNGINFLLYCVMSRDFRKTLVSLFNSLLCQGDKNSFRRIRQNESPQSKTKARRCSQMTELNTT